MKKVLAAIVVVIILAGLGVGAYVVTHPDKRAKVSTNTQTNNTSGSSDQNAPAASIVQTKTSATVGQYLADSAGNALYTYGPDQPGVSNCSGLCTYNWPIYEATTTTNLPANVTVITRSDGSKQYAYKDQPLYTFTDDAPGQVTGNNVNDFHVAKP